MAGNNTEPHHGAADDLDGDSPNSPASNGPAHATPSELEALHHEIARLKMANLHLAKDGAKTRNRDESAYPESLALERKVLELETSLSSLRSELTTTKDALSKQKSRFEALLLQAFKREKDLRATLLRLNNEVTSRGEMLNRATAALRATEHLKDEWENRLAEETRRLRSQLDTAEEDRASLRLALESKSREAADLHAARSGNHAQVAELRLKLAGEQELLKSATAAAIQRESELLRQLAELDTRFHDAEKKLAAADVRARQLESAAQASPAPTNADPQNASQRAQDYDGHLRDLDAERETVSQLRHALAQRESQIADLERRLSDAVDTQTRQLAEVINREEAGAAQLHDLLNQARLDADSLRTQAAETSALLDQRTQDYQLRVATLEAELVDNHNHIESLKKELAVSRETLDSITGGAAGREAELIARITELTDQIGQAELTSLALQAEVKTHSTTADNLRKELASLAHNTAKREADLAASVATLTARLEESDQLAQSLKAGWNAEAATADNLRKELATLSGNATEREMALLARSSDLSARLEIAERRALDLKTDLDAATTTTNRLRDELTTAQANTAERETGFQSRITELTTQLEESLHNAGAIQAELNSATSTADQLRSERDSLISQSAAQTAELDAKILALTQQLSESNLLSQSLQTQLDTAAATIGTLQAEIHSITTAAASHTTELDAKISELTRQLWESERNSLALKTELDARSSTADSLRKELEVLTARLQTLTDESASDRQALAQLRTELTDANTRRHELEETLEFRIKTSTETARTALEQQFEDEITRLRSDLAEASARGGSFQVELERTKQELLRQSMGFEARLVKVQKELIAKAGLMAQAKRLAEEERARHAATLHSASTENMELRSSLDQARSELILVSQRAEDLALQLSATSENARNLEVELIDEKQSATQRQDCLREQLDAALAEIERNRSDTDAIATTLAEKSEQVVTLSAKLDQADTLRQAEVQKLEIQSLRLNQTVDELRVQLQRMKEDRENMLREKQLSEEKLFRLASRIKDLYENNRDFISRVRATGPEVDDWFANPSRSAAPALLPEQNPQTQSQAQAQARPPAQSTTLPQSPLPQPVVHPTASARPARGPFRFGKGVRPTLRILVAFLTAATAWHCKDSLLALRPTIVSQLRSAIQPALATQPPAATHPATHTPSTDHATPGTPQQVISFGETPLDTLDAESPLALSRMAELANAIKPLLDRFDLIVEGHTGLPDITCEPPYPDTRSIELAGATAVREALITRHGFPQDAVFAKAANSTETADSTDHSPPLAIRTVSLKLLPKLPFAEMANANTHVRLATPDPMEEDAFSAAPLP